MHHRLPASLAVMGCAALIGACGGSPGGPSTLDTETPAAAVALLATDNPSLALAVSGQARHFVIRNDGTLRALGIAVTPLQALPPGTVLSTTCGDLDPGGTCSVDIAPGDTASAARGDAAPVPVGLRIAGSNTDPLDVAFQVLGYGSVYQGGHVFAIDDSTDATRSVGGKVLGLTGLSAAWTVDSTGDPNGNTTGTTSATDGQANTQGILAHMATLPAPVDAQQQPAGICDEWNAAGHTDWYLPAVCEFSYDFLDPTRVSDCGTQGSPGMQNVQSALLDGPQPIAQVAASSWWSSTERGLNPTGHAYHYTPNTDIWLSSKATVRGVACARVLTP